MLSISSMLKFALSILPLMRRYGYEIFLYSHRAIAVVLMVALWQHVRSRPTLSRILLEVIFGGLLASTVFQNVRQLYRNTAWDRHGIHPVRIMKARQCGDSLIVKIQLARPWKIQPGDFIYLRLLTLKCASIFQRHPFVITWWEEIDEANASEDANGQDENKIVKRKQKNADENGKARILYVMIDPQHGWTQNVMARQSVFENKTAWLDGPFGSSYRLEEYSTVILFASGNGIFAQLPLLKGLAEGLKSSAVKTRRIKLIWQTEVYHKQLQEWMHDILRDEEFDKELLDICIHQPISTEQLEAHEHIERHRVHTMNRWVRIIYDVPDVEGYIRLELSNPKKSTAVTVSGHGQLRHDVQRGVIYAKGYNVRLFELDYQPSYTNKLRGGTVA